MRCLNVFGVPLSAAISRYRYHKALLDSDLNSEDICRKAMRIASDMCVYTNNHLTVETLETKPSSEKKKKD